MGMLLCVFDEKFVKLKRIAFKGINDFATFPDDDTANYVAPR